MNSMLREVMVLVCLGAMAVSSFAAPLSSSVRPAIPAEVQQIICVDYRALKNSDVAQALKAQVLPDNLKEFETALKSTGIDTNRDVDTLTFIAYRLPKQGLRMVGAAQGAFALKDILRKLKLQKVKPVKYRDSDIYPMANGMQMTFLDDTTLLFGDGSAVRGSLDARDGYTQTLDSNPDIANLIEGEASRLADFETIKKRILGSRYTMGFQNGVSFDMDVVTSDSVSAATLSSLVKAGVLYKKMTASPAEKTALEGVSIDSNGSKAQVHFKADDRQFQSLMRTNLFAALSK